MLIILAITGCSNSSEAKSDTVENKPLSINDKAISLIKEGKFSESNDLLYNDLKKEYDIDNIHKESLSIEKRKEYNLFLYSFAKDIIDYQGYIPALQYYKELEPIDGIITQDEITVAIADLTPKAEAAKQEIDTKKNKNVKPEIGMTHDEAINSTWGKPKDINTTTTADMVSEQWVYSGNRYLYFDNGILTTIQE
ncbi:hypothetical protein D3C87_645750 [compost metagenome]